jgi:hypothetical protein
MNFKEWLIDIESETGGYKQGDLIVAYGRGTGKSIMNSYADQWFTTMAERKIEITHGELVGKQKFKYWVKVNGPWGLERQINEWCSETYGALDTPGYNNPRWDNRRKFGVYNFKHEADVTLFLLRWA